MLSLLDINLLSDKRLVRVLPCFVGRLFTLTIVSFAGNLLDLIPSHLSIPAIISPAIRILSRKSLPKLASWSVSLTFFLQSFQNFSLYIKVVHPFWINFYAGWEIRISSTHLRVSPAVCSSETVADIFIGTPMGLSLGPLLCPLGLCLFLDQYTFVVVIPMVVSWYDLNLGILKPTALVPLHRVALAI